MRRWRWRDEERRLREEELSVVARLCSIVAVVGVGFAACCCRVVSAEMIVVVVDSGEVVVGEGGSEDGRLREMVRLVLLTRG